LKKNESFDKVVSTKKITQTKDSHAYYNLLNGGIESPDFYLARGRSFAIRLKVGQNVYATTKCCTIC
jgi:hypothetical protein